MKIVKKLVSGLFWLLIIALLVAPLGLIYQISADEMEAYQTPETPVLRETSMGEACQAMRIDLRESVRVSGKFVSASYAYMELDQRTPSSIRWLLAIYTGRVYNGTLVLPEDCVYQKEDQEDAPWYVRQVTEDGFLIGEQEVQVGYSDGEYVCVTGVEEGAWFDSGYKAIAGG